MKLDIAKLRYVIFDWDNTLAESRTTLVYTVNQVLKEYGLPDWEEVKKHRDKDLSFRDNFPNIFGADKAAAAYARYYELYLDNVKHQIKTFPGVRETLDFFKEHQIQMIIMSNKDRRLLEYELPFLFDKELFAQVVCGHEAARDKPYPEQAYYALNGWLKPEEITPDKVWIIGDSEQDSDCALAAGALPIRVGKAIWDDACDKKSGVLFFADFKEFLSAL